MEDNTVRVDEIEEVEPDVEIEEDADSSNNGAFAAGIAGGFLAYAVIGAAKKLIAFVQAKRAERKQKAETEIIDAEYTVISDEKEDSGDESFQNK